jgi:signal transduction histidine kinase
MKPRTEIRSIASALSRRKSSQEDVAGTTRAVNLSASDARAALINAELDRPTRNFVWTEDDEESLRVLKLGGALGILMLLAYLAYDQHLRGPEAPGGGLHWLVLGITCLFFSLVWTQAFKRSWKLWTYLYLCFLIGMFVAISHFTADPESRFIAIALCPLATAAFVSWGARWQFVMALTTIGSYAAAELLVPIETPFGAYRWMGLLASLIFAQSTTVFIDRYRRRLHKQVYDLEEAARFRQNQIATMAHDIRSPVAALSGYANLLDDDDLNSKDRTDLLGRISSTAWNMNLVVSNVLDYYDLQDNDIVAAPVELDPNIVIAEVAEDCALQARRRRLTLRTEFARLPNCRLDPRLLDRIVRNLLAYSINRTPRGEVVLRTGMHHEMIVIDVSDSGAPAPLTELDRLLQAPSKDGRSPGPGLGLFVAKAMAEAVGGGIKALNLPSRGLTLLVELPLDLPERITRSI